MILVGSIFGKWHSMALGSFVIGDVLACKMEEDL